MRKLIAPILIVCLAGFYLAYPKSTKSAAGFVQFATGWNTASALTVVTGQGGGTNFGATSTGDSIICIVRIGNNSSTISSVVDSLGNTFSVGVARITSGARASALYYFNGITGGAGYTVTMTVSANAFDNTIVCHEVSGISGAPTATGSDNAEAGIPVDCPAMIPSVDGAYIFAGAATVANTDTFAPDTSTNLWVEQGEINGATDSDVQAQYFIQTTAASITPKWTQSSTGSSMCVAAVFSPSGGGATSKVATVTLKGQMFINGGGVNIR